MISAGAYSTFRAGLEPVHQSGLSGDIGYQLAQTSYVIESGVAALPLMLGVGGVIATMIWSKIVGEDSANDGKPRNRFIENEMVVINPGYGVSE